MIDGSTECRGVEIAAHIQCRVVDSQLHGWRGRGIWEIVVGIIFNDFCYSIFFEFNRTIRVQPLVESEYAVGPLPISSGLRLHYDLFR